MPAELPRSLPVHFEYSIDVVACHGRSYVVDWWSSGSAWTWRAWLSGFRRWRLVAGDAHQPMPAAMSHAFYGITAIRISSWPMVLAVGKMLGKLC